MEEAVVNWILADSLPLSAIETPAFLRLFRLAAPAAPLPSIQRLRELFSSMLDKAPGQSQPSLNFNGGGHLLPNPFTVSMGNGYGFDAKNPFGTANHLNNSL
ncbi:hypothetical protein DSO57_1013933 [Entomophthora muscae]|nr:hypothetical protein DSO57_1013933 [Entomophthora muscae]